MPDSSISKPAYRKIVAALVASEERYRVLVEGVKRYAIFMLNPKGIILTWNRGIEELLGFGRDEIVGKSGAMVFNAADGGTRGFRRELASARQSGECVTERANVCKDGSEVRVHDTVTSLLDSKSVLIGFAKVTRRLEAAIPSETVALELADALARIQVEVEHRRQLEAQLLTAVEEERERLGRDLHDDLSQRLAGIAMITRTLAGPMPGRRKADREKISEVGDLLADAVGVARNLSRGLHPVLLTTQGLAAALADLAKRVPAKVVFHWPEKEPLTLESDIALHAYRIAEEAVGNAIKHSGAKNIRLELRKLSARRGRLIICDDGKGFVQSDKSDGMGLQNMKYRAGVLGGALTISTAVGDGTCVECILPLR